MVVINDSYYYYMSDLTWMLLLFRLASIQLIMKRSEGIKMSLDFGDNVQQLNPFKWRHIVINELLD